LQTAQGTFSMRLTTA